MLPVDKAVPASRELRRVANRKLVVEKHLSKCSRVRRGRKRAHQVCVVAKELAGRTKALQGICVFRQHSDQPGVPQRMKDLEEYANTAPFNTVEMGDMELNGKKDPQFTDLMQKWFWSCRTPQEVFSLLKSQLSSMLLHSSQILSNILNRKLLGVTVHYVEKVQSLSGLFFIKILSLIYYVSVGKTKDFRIIAKVLLKLLVDVDREYSCFKEHLLNSKSVLICKV